MEVRLIEINNFGNIEYFMAKPGKGISVVKDRCAGDAMLALAEALSYPTNELGDFYALKKSGFSINLQADSTNECDKLNYINLLPGCKEALKCRIFLNDGSQEYNKRLLFYKRCDDYYDKKAFDRETDHLGHMRSFRSVLFAFIGKFKPVALNAEKNLYVDILPSGEFIIKNIQTGKDQTKMLGSREKTLFQFICFLEVNRFWDEIAEIRAIDPPKMPLLAANFNELADVDQSGTGDIIAYIRKLKYQLIIFSDV